MATQRKRLNASVTVNDSPLEVAEALSEGEYVDHGNGYVIVRVPIEQTIPLDLEDKPKPKPKKKASKKKE